MQRIGQREWVQGERLPAENELAKELGVSRTTLREALGVLEDRGLVLRRHGIGSFVAAPGSGILVGVEKLENFTDTIVRAGHRAEEKVLSIHSTGVPEAIADSLRVTPASPAWKVESLRLADGQPIIFCVDYIPATLVPGTVSIEAREDTPVLDMFRDWGYAPKYAFISIRAVLPDHAVMRALKPKRNEPLVLLAGAVYSSERSPLYHGSAYIRSDFYQLTLVRRTDA